MNDLIEALKAQTESINRLSESNEALVSIIADLLQSRDEEDFDSGGYLSAPRSA